jgi:hypothetical protein
VNLSGAGAVERGMRTILLALLFSSALSFTPAPLPIVDPELTLTAANGKDGGKKKKDEEKEEDYALKMKAETAFIS